MTMSVEAERALLGKSNIGKRDVDKALAEAKKNYAGLQFKDGAGAKLFADKIRALEAIDTSSWRHTFGSDYLSKDQQAQVRSAVQDVGAARLHAQRENLPADKLMRNPGDDAGIYREKDSGEIVRRDPGARTAAEKRVVNPDEPGIFRDADTGKVVGRDAGAKTMLEKIDEKEAYQTSGKKVYRPGATADQVQDGSRMVREGDYGEGVKKMQTLLRNAGYDVGSVDGYYGPKTAAAAKKFLDEQNNPQGYIGPDEMKILEAKAKKA